MTAIKDNNGTWFVPFRYTDWKGNRKQKLKRGFQTRKDALAWERDFLQQKTSDLDMTFETFLDLYMGNMKGRLRESTYRGKKYVIDSKILPYFKDKKMSEIKPSDIINWQNEIMQTRDENGNPYATGYLKSVHSQLSAIFNHAIRFYELKSNPATKAGSMGREQSKEMKFWTKDEYIKFSSAIMKNPIAFHAYEMLYWCGIRLGELLALTRNDFDFETRILTINKSYQRINKKDVITEPKTPRSNRTIKMPKFLCDEMKEYFDSLYGVEPTDRVFPITKNFLHREMVRGCKLVNMEKIRIHDLRHSHVSLLIEMGFTAVAIADRMGHESIRVTFRYAHLFPSKQNEMADRLDKERSSHDRER